MLILYLNVEMVDEGENNGVRRSSCKADMDEEDNKYANSY